MTDRARPQWWLWLTGITAVLVALACGVVLWSFMPPVVDFVYFALAGWALLILGAVWLVATLIGWFKYRAWRWSAAAPVIVVATLGLVMLSVPSRVAFALSEGALTEAAAECQEATENRTIGVYRIESVRKMDGGCVFFIEGGLIDGIGLAYLPNGAPYLGDPRFDGDFGYKEYEGDWYRFVQRF